MRAKRAKTGGRRITPFEVGQQLIWMQTRGGGGGSGKRKNEKEPLPCTVVRDDGKAYVQIATDPSTICYPRRGSWVRRSNLRREVARG